MNHYIDFWNLMSYDYSGSWGTVAGYDVSIYASTSNPSSTPVNSDQAITYYANHGVPADKIVIGIPLYGRSFQNTDGPGTPYSSVGQGSWDIGVWDYKALPQDGATVQTDTQAGSSWSYDPFKRTMISYDTPEIARAKAAYIR
jgi:chitinase